MKINLAIIGYGKLAKCIVQGLTINKNININISSPSFEKNIPPELQPSNCSSDNLAFIEQADLILLSVKPMQIPSVAAQISSKALTSKCLISVAAGMEMHTIEEALTVACPIIRAMPNTSAAIQQSPTALIANNYCIERHKQQVEYLFNQLGQSCWIDDESKMDVLTALIGSSPAFLYEFIHQLSLASQALGLNAQEAKMLASQMAVGAANMANQNFNELLQLKAQVTSKGGTTAAGLAALSDNNFELCIQQAIKKATQRAIELK